MRLKRVAELTLDNWKSIPDGFRPALLEQKLLTEEGFATLLQARTDEISDAKLQLVVPYLFAWGKKNSDAD